ncbi:MAG: stress response translation initiation inhibitor YciH, partial [Candidatus Hodarchaeales archaeon]
GKLACGGTAKDDRIELQGNHMARITELLEAEGFPTDRIDIAWATGRSRGRRRG